MGVRPKYSDRAHAYCRRIAAGEELSSKWMILAAKRHLADLAKAATGARWFFDTKRVDACCSFVETLPLAGDKPFVLSDWQVWILASLIGWVDADGLRKYIEALVLVPKGNGKSPLAAALGLWFAFFDGRYGAEVYCGALSIAQAQEVFTPARAFIEAVPAFADAGITAQKRSIFGPGNSRFQPVIGRGRHGSRPYLAILDELHQATTSDLYGTFKTGCNKTLNSLLLVISTAGVASIDNPCYQLQDRGQRALNESPADERLFVAIYCADDTVEWNSDAALRMANPNLGISNDAEKLRIALDKAAQNPAQQNNVRAMHLNQWSTAAVAWMNMQIWNFCYDHHLSADSVRHLPCWIGCDLASKLDLSAVVRLYRDDSKGPKPHYYALSRAYLPQTRVDAPECTYYFDWAERKQLTATPGSSIDYDVLERDALADIGAAQVQEIAYDARYADQWSQRVSDISGIQRVEVPPSPAMLSPAMKELEAAVNDLRFHHDGNEVFKWCMGNVLTRETGGGGNYTMPTKARPEAKIDVAIALFIAMGRARLGAAPPADIGGFCFA